MLALLLALVLAAPAAAKTEPKSAKLPADAVDPKLLEGLAWRSIGPYRGGRVTAVTGVAGQPRVYYFGATGGGVWKTTDAGTTWLPITDGQIATGSVGAIAVAASDPNVIYLGMGESPIRGNVSHGDGVYRSTDAGKTWKHVGLADSRHISRVRVHPQDPNLVYVAAQGHAFGPNVERGIFRSKDAGKTWEKICFVDDKTGATELAIDPTNPRILYAGFWQVLRKPWTFESGGPGGQIRRSTDGGDSWEKLEGNGLPKGLWGNIGIAISAADPNRIYAIIEAEKGGVFRSDDGGKKWRLTNEENDLRQRAWYYTRIYADPKDADSVYVVNVQFWHSKDGAKSFKPIRTPHGDNHDLWIAPEDPLRMIEGNDGGAQVTVDGGATWTRQDNQPTGQFYHVIADDRFPYWVYGAQQDNSTVAIASRTDHGAIGASDWYPVGGCESGYVAPKPGSDGAVVYAGCYDGVITRLDRRTGQRRDITVYPENPMGWGAEGMKYRFQWTFPIVASSHDPGTLYAAGNVLFRSTNEGQSWEPISPDLTRNDPSKLGPSGGPITKDNTSVEYYCTIFALAESRREKGLLWAGTDDGLVHVSRDAGTTWTNVTPKDLPEWSMVSQIDASPHDPATAYVAINRYKHDDFRPFVYVTHDYGKTWSKRTAGIPETTFVRAVREDPAAKGLLYAGTETGVYVSWDDGAHWQSLQLKLPAVPVTDLALKDGDLVVSTQGRGFWILDEASTLRQIKPDLASAEAHLFEPAAAYRFFGGGGRRSRPGVGQNPPDGAILSYFLKSAPKEKEEITLEILDASGASLRTFSNIAKEEEGEKKESGGGDDDERGGGGSKTLPAKAGLNRFAWDLRLTEATKVKGMILWGGTTDGPVVVPGTYQAKLTAGGKSSTQRFEVRKDPRLSVTPAELQKQFDLLLQIRDTLGAAHDAILRIRGARDQVSAAAERAKGTPEAKAIADAAEELKKKLTVVEEALYQTKNKAQQDPLNYPIRLNDKLAALADVVASAEAAPTEGSLVVYADLSQKIRAQLASLEAVLTTELPAFNSLVKAKDVPAVVLKPETTKKP
jgi:photosystem II stability/assembly factor-like uncharacterized protein